MQNFPKPINSVINVYNIYVLNSDVNNQIHNNYYYQFIPVQKNEEKPSKRHPRNKFTPKEDEILNDIVNDLLEQKSLSYKLSSNLDWHEIAKKMNTGRNARQCRERWNNYLSPLVENGIWTNDEDALLLQKYNEYGPKWKKISSFFKSRTDINIKSRWNLIQRKNRRLASKLHKLKNNIDIKNDVKP